MSHPLRMPLGSVLAFMLIFLLPLSGAEEVC